MSYEQEEGRIRFEVDFIRVYATDEQIKSDFKNMVGGVLGRHGFELQGDVTIKYMSTPYTDRASFVVYKKAGTAVNPYVILSFVERYGYSGIIVVRTNMIPLDPKVQRLKLIDWPRSNSEVERELKELVVRGWMSKEKAKAIFKHFYDMNLFEEEEKAEIRTKIAQPQQQIQAQPQPQVNLSALALLALILILVGVGK